MDASPLSSPAVRRTSSPPPSPPPSHDGSAPSASLSSDDVPPASTPEASPSDAEDGPDNAAGSAPHRAREAFVTQLKGKEKARDGPLRLLDLPVDVLKEIIHQLPHTNDLTSLALCHSALHRLTIPCIYSRFDIVWPDESTHTEPRTGVDALTYGLATLVFAEDSFPHQNRRRQQSLAEQHASTGAATPYPIPRRWFGNNYAQFTKKFSLGNGPAAWVQEYMISKEGGKMLGTLVAMAVARMINLETFVWDMPTGVLRDVWLALSSLADRADGEESRLDRLWVRWHDNTIDSPAPVPPPPMMLGNVPPPPNTAHPSGAGAVQAPVPVPPHLHYPSITTTVMDRVEYPTFSVVPALKSLSVLDLDELPYLDEMSILIARSQRKLRELRVGIAPHAQQRDWVTAWEGDGIQQVDYSSTWPGSTAISEKRLGGVLGILVGRVHNMRQDEELQCHLSTKAGSSDRPVELSATKVGLAGLASSLAQSSLQDRDVEPADQFDGPFSASAVQEGAVHEGISLSGSVPPPTAEHVAQPAAHLAGMPAGHGFESPFSKQPVSPPAHQEQAEVSKDPVLNGKLRLEVLELERVPLSVSVLLKAFDWSMLTTLTLLHCNNHEQLWKSLRRTYTPRQPYPAGSPAASTKAYKASYTLRSEYGLSLKKIHTNTVSPSLISFLKDTLAPNTLEVLFLQEGRSYSSTVTVDAIYRGPLRRHRASLKKLMIDSSEKGPDGHATSSSRWRRWMLNREIITFITSGRMTNLRELAVSIDYRDWHHFLQRLPLMPQIRSLYIPYIADHAHGNNIDPRELAMQILDIVHLRPDIEICYMGLMHKCYEILENRPSNYDLRHDNVDGNTYTQHDPLMSDDESEVTEDEDEDDLDGGIGPAGNDDDSDSNASEDDHEDSDGDESFMQDDKRVPKLRLREILFYEEKIETLRARHGVLKP
ncbi:hypothetical protein P154DRAFT_516568 [Amniculicola lignicola CBS 123094]|uniref:F-box domain-containing protein n=1 Tax=Amniculicola lignicola CBS 123094 TaxID=1392246 RepID=A0A6A5X4I3_9PLEO|nr:hypothetical protein P154DRAFT_516568 [Amniculicola lignicola CBS 123094]